MKGEEFFVRGVKYQKKPATRLVVGEECVGCAGYFDLELCRELPPCVMFIDGDSDERKKHFIFTNC